MAATPDGGWGGDNGGGSMCTGAQPVPAHVGLIRIGGHPAVGRLTGWVSGWVSAEQVGGWVAG